MFYQWQDDVLIINVKVQPRSSKNGFAEVMGDGTDECIKLKLTAEPVDGKANSQLQAVIAKLFNVPKSAVSIISGDKSRNKRVRIEHPKQLPEGIEVR